MREPREVMIQPVGSHDTDPFAQQDTSPTSITCPLCESASITSTKDSKELAQFRAMEDLITTAQSRIKQLGIKKSHVAEKIGCTPMEFSHFLKGRRPLRDNSLVNLKNYLSL